MENKTCFYLSNRALLAKDLVKGAPLIMIFEAFILIIIKKPHVT